MPPSLSAVALEPAKKLGHFAVLPVSAYPQNIH
jgi:hypothetical protein